MPNGRPLVLDDNATGAAAMVTIPLFALGWAAVGALYLTVRVLAALHAPVAGSELWSLSGAWAAHAGADDARFAGALTQAVAAASFAFTESPLAARFAVVILGACGMAVAVLRLRPAVGDGPLLTAGALLALDPFMVALGGSASALALDVPVALLLFAFSLRAPAAPWPWALLGAAVALSGPLPLALAFAALAAGLVQGRFPKPSTAAFTTAGAVVGVIVASFGFGFARVGVAVPPADLFAASFDAPWSTGAAGAMALLYGWPVLAAGGGSAVWFLLRWLRDGIEPPPAVRLALVWGAIGLLWLLTAAGAHSWAVVPAVSVPGALVAGAAAPSLWNALATADWRLARVAVPAAGLLGASAALFAFGWAFSRPHGSAPLALVLAAGVLAMVALLAAARPTRPAALVLPLAFGCLWLVAMTGRAAAPAAPEPLYSPASTDQGRVIRAAALELAAGHGRVAVHPDLVDAVIWPLRGSGTILVTDRPTPDVAVYLAPVGVAPPEGFLPLEGSWALLRLTEPPDTPRAILRWLASRNVHPSRDVPVSFAARPAP